MKWIDACGALPYAALPYICPYASNTICMSGGLPHLVLDGSCAAPAQQCRAQWLRAPLRGRTRPACRPAGCPGQRRHAPHPTTAQQSHTPGRTRPARGWDGGLRRSRVPAGETNYRRGWCVVLVACQQRSTHKKVQAAQSQADAIPGGVSPACSLQLVVVPS